MGVCLPDIHCLTLKTVLWLLRLWHFTYHLHLQVFERWRPARQEWNLPLVVKWGNQIVQTWLEVKFHSEWDEGRGCGFHLFCFARDRQRPESALNIVTAPRVHVLCNGYQVSEHESSPPNTPTINPDKHIVEVGSMACCAFETSLLLELEITVWQGFHMFASFLQIVKMLDHQRSTTGIWTMSSLAESVWVLALSCHMSVYIRLPMPIPPMPRPNWTYS